MKRKWSKGNIGQFWTKDQYSDLPFERQPLQQYEIDKWVELGYDHVKSFSGMMYDNRNPMGEWVSKIGNLFDLADQTYTIYKMQTLEIMPEHVDHFSTYMRLFGAEYKDIRRVLVMLEDWKPGHYLEIDGVGFTNWIAGDWFMWESDVPHAASNIGVEDRYTLQITGTVIDAKASMTNLHWFNIPKLPEKFETLRFPYTKVINEKFFDDSPTYLYMFNGNITELENIKHDEETVTYLNGKGIHIYLNEPLCCYKVGAMPIRENDRVGTKHNMWFYTELPHDMSPDDLRADELDSILKYATDNKLTNITVHTCDYNVEAHYPAYTSILRLVTDDIFVKSQFNLRRNPDSVRLTNNFTKKFICLNWRYTRHRFLLAAYLSNLSGYMTWYFKAGCGILSNSPWLKIFETWSTQHSTEFAKVLGGIIHLNNRTPVNIDLNIKIPTMITHHYFFDAYPNNDVINDIIKPGIENYEKLKDFYSDIFVDIVTESRFAQPTANFSEKTLQPIFYKKPFILAAPPRTLEYMKGLGFKTFSEFWDESYDDCHDHETRLLMIFKLIDEINDKSIDELKIMYDKMTDILEHNFMIANSIIPEVGET